MWIAKHNLDQDMLKYICNIYCKINKKLKELVVMFLFIDLLVYEFLYLDNLSVSVLQVSW